MTNKSTSPFDIGDKVKLLKVNKSEGVVVHRQSIVKDNKEWCVHWYNITPGSGIYSADEIKKYY